MYRAFCRKCGTLLFDMPSISAMFSDQNKVEIVCRGCGYKYIVTHGLKDILFRHSKGRPSVAQYYH